MRIKHQTFYFGEIEVDDTDIITFEDGIMPFEDDKRFVLLDDEKDGVPFMWLQSMDQEGLAWAIINPFLFKPDYDFELTDEIVSKIGLEDPKDIAVFSVVQIPDNVKFITANLMSPLIINGENRKGVQFVMNDKRYHARHNILDEMSAEDVLKKWA